MALLSCKNPENIFKLLPLGSEADSQISHLPISGVISPLQTLRGTVPKSIVEKLPRKHAKSQQFAKSLPGYPGIDVKRSVLSGLRVSHLPIIG